MKNRIMLVAIAAFAYGCGGSDTDAKSTPDGGGAASGGSGAASGAGGNSGSTSSGAIGDPCATAETCPAGGSGSPVCLTEGWSGGYCAVEGCEQHGHDCPNDPGLGGTAKVGGKCVIDGAANRCLALCATTADCREGYSCVPLPDAAGHGSADVCYPDATSGSGGSGGMSGGGGGGMQGGGGGMSGGGMMDGGM